MGHHRPLFQLFSAVSNSSTMSTATECEKWSSNLRCRDQNSWPLYHQSPPIIIRTKCTYLILCNWMAVNCTNLLIEWANVLYNNWPIAFYKLTSASTNQPRLGFLHVSIHYGYVESTTTLGELHFWRKSTPKCLYKGYP